METVKKSLYLVVAGDTDYIGHRLVEQLLVSQGGIFQTWFFYNRLIVFKFCSEMTTIAISLTKTTLHV